MHLTIAYLTNRRDPKIEWFFDSLNEQLAGNYSDIRIVVVDFYADAIGRREQIASLARCPLTQLIHVPPKPNVWQGTYRLATRDYFAASNTRNTAICLAPDGYIAFIDDLSVMLPGWIREVRLAMSGGYVALGTFQKVLGLEVEPGTGKVLGYRDHLAGHDCRLKSIFGDEPRSVNGGWLFGCSFAAPVQALLDVNGFDEDCDSMSGEDYICGLMMTQHGYDLRFCPRMKTLESEELHFVDPPFLRIIKADASGRSNDASHVMLNMVMKGNRRRAPNYFGNDGIAAVRQRVLAGEGFPVTQIPEHHWPDGQPIREM